MPFRLVRIITLLMRFLSERNVRSGRSAVKPHPSTRETLRKADRRPGVHFGEGESAKDIYGSRTTILYSEKVFSRLLFFIFFAGVVLSGWLVMKTQPDEDPLTVAALSVITILFFVFLFLLLNFSSLAIRAGFDDLRVRYGVFSYRVDWIDVTEMILENERSGARPFPGIRMRSLHDGHWKLYYSAGLPRVTLGLEGPVREFSFTTNSPEKFMTIARDCVNRKRSRAQKKFSGNTREG